MGPSNPSINTAQNTNKKPMGRNTKIPNQLPPKKPMGAQPTSSGLRKGGGFKARRVATAYDPNSVDMTRKPMNVQQRNQTKQESFPSLSAANAGQKKGGS